MTDTEINLNEKDDMVFYQEGGEIMSGGFSIDSILLKLGLPAMEGGAMIGGGGGYGVSANTKNMVFSGGLAVPAGLYSQYGQGIGQSGGKKSNNKYDENIDNDLYDKLFDKMVNIKREKSKTRKHGKINKGNTRKLSTRSI
jgi:hypothetical protein